MEIKEQLTVGQPEVKRQNLDECKSVIFEPQAQL